MALFADPLSIDLILENILQYVGIRNNRAELLNCRLVNHFWNRKATQFLNHLRGKGKCRMTLDHRNIEDYLAMIRAKSRSSCKNTPQEKSCSMHLSINLSNMEFSNTFLADLQKYCFNTATVVAVIIFGFGKTQQPPAVLLPDQCSHGLTESDFWNFIQAASANLQELQLFGTFALAQKSMESPPIAPLAQIGHFPQLRTVYFEIREMHDNKAAINTMENVCQLINSAPYLQCLRLIDAKQAYEVDDSGSIREHAIQFLTRLSISTRTATLTDVEIPIYSLEILNALGQFQFAQLKKLIIHQFVPGNIARLLCESVLQNCRSLSSFQIIIDKSAISSQLVQFPSNPEFAVEFVQVTHFGLFNNQKCLGYHLTPHKAQFFNLLASIAQLFPALEHASASLTFCVALSRDGDFRHAARAVFPTVTTLTLTLNIHVYKNSFREASGEHLVQFYQQMFPSVSKLVIDVQVQYRNGSQKDRHDVLQLLLSVPAGIRSLELKNYYEEWLVQLLMDQHPAVVAIRENLEHLRIGTHPNLPQHGFRFHSTSTPTSYSGSASGKSSWNAKICFTSILERFPKLTLLEIEETQWAKHQDKNQSSLAEVISELETQYRDRCTRIRLV